MLYEFILDHRDRVIERCSAQLETGSASGPEAVALGRCIPVFLDQLIHTLRVENESDLIGSVAISGGADGDGEELSEIGRMASLYGRELSQQGFTVKQLVHSYGAICQAISGLAVDNRAQIEADEFRTLNRCLDNAIAAAVTEFLVDHDTSATAAGLQAANLRLGYLAHEVRNLVHTAMLATAAIKSGTVGMNGATGQVLERSLAGLARLIDDSLGEVRAAERASTSTEQIQLHELLASIEASARLEVERYNCLFSTADIDKSLFVEADRQMLCSAITNIVQNAFKFTRPETEVTLSATADRDWIFIEVADQGGGFAPSFQDRLFSPFSQGNENRSGLGLGLSIAKRSIEANRGSIRVRVVPDSGCVFTIVLPRSHSGGEVGRQGSGVRLKGVE